LLGPGNASLFESFFAITLCSNSFPTQKRGEIRGSFHRRRKGDRDRWCGPIKDVAEKMNDAVASGIATEKIGQIASNSAQFATDIAPLRPTPRRRARLAARDAETPLRSRTLGFLVALYNLLGSTARSLATEQGAALFERFRKASKPVEFLL